MRDLASNFSIKIVSKWIANWIATGLAGQDNSDEALSSPVLLYPRYSVDTLSHLGKEEKVELKKLLKL